MGVSHLEGNIKSLLANLASMFLMAALTYFSENIVQHFVPSAVSRYDNYTPKYMSGF